MKTFSMMVFLIGGLASAENGSIFSNPCIEELEKSMDGKATYKFVKTTTDSVNFDVVEIPLISADRKYITFYTEKGYTEMNTKTGACNSKSNDAAKDKNATTKLMSVFLQRQKELLEIKASAEALGKPIYPNFKIKESPALKSLEENCAKMSNSIRLYLAGQKTGVKTSETCLPGEICAPK